MKKSSYGHSPAGGVGGELLPAAQTAKTAAQDKRSTVMSRQMPSAGWKTRQGEVRPKSKPPLAKT